MVLTLSGPAAWSFTPGFYKAGNRVIFAAHVRETPIRSTRLSVGEPAPWFTAASTTNPRYHFDSVAGRYVVLCFFGSAASAPASAVLAGFLQQRALFNDADCCFFGVSADAGDQREGRVREALPGIRFLWDFDGAIARQFGLVDAAGAFTPCTYVLDERLRVFASVPLEAPAEKHVQRVCAVLEARPRLPEGQAAPVLVVPRVFEPALCKALIAHYETHGGSESGFMRERDGKTIGVQDHSFKRRRDQEIVDEELKNAAMHRVHGRIAPEIRKAFQFNPTRIERHIISCYDAETGGFFRAHRDNTTPGTAHRRFAVTLNLNTGEYEGGGLRFPEFGSQTYAPPPGAAVVFSCSLLHEAVPVTAGRRYAYLPFLYDDAAAEVRIANRGSLL